MFWSRTERSLKSGEIQPANSTNHVIATAGPNSAQHKWVIQTLYRHVRLGNNFPYETRPTNSRASMGPIPAPLQSQPLTLIVRGGQTRPMSNQAEPSPPVL